MRMLSLVFFLAVAACANPGGDELTPADLAFREQVLQLVNDQRRAGCQCGSKYMPPVPVLQWNDQLEAAAAKHARDMEEHGFFAHIGSDGSKISDRVDATGYSWSSVGENIAQGYRGAEYAVQAWIESPTHCRQLMSDVYREMGVARSGKYWVQTLGVGLE